MLKQTLEYLNQYANQGLRTLLLAEKTIDEEEYNQWNEAYQEASLAMENREKLM